MSEKQVKAQTQDNRGATRLISRMLPLGLNTRAVIGVDIGYRDIKVTEFRRRLSDNDWVLETCQILAVPVAANEQEADGTRANILRTFFAGKNLKETKVICVVNDVNSVTTKILTPLISLSELKEAISWKMKDLTHVPIEELSIDFKIMGKVEVEGQTKDEILVVACSQKIVNRYLALFREAKVLPSSFVTLVTCLKHNLKAMGAKESQTLAFLDLGALHSELMIMRGDRFIFARKLPVCGNDITKALSTVLEGPSGKISLSFLDAEKIKIDSGIPSSTNEPVPGKAMTGNQILALIRPQVEKIASEIEHSFDYYCEEFSDSKVDRLILIGAGANLKGLDTFLSRELNMPVEVSNPFKGSSVTQGEKACAFFACVGASQSMIVQVQSGAEEINLLPTEVKEQNRLLLRRIALELLITVFVLANLLVFIGLKLGLAGMHKRLEALRAQEYSLRYGQKQVELKNFINKIYSREPRWREVLRELSNIIPENAYLEHFSYSKDELMLEGAVISKTDTTEGILSDFMLALEKGVFKNVNLLETKRKKDSMRFVITEFKLKCQVE